LIVVDSFATDVDWLMERTVGTGTNRVSFGPHIFISGFCRWCRPTCRAALERMVSEAASLDSRWTGRRQKSKLWAAGRMNHQQS